MTGADGGTHRSGKRSSRRPACTWRAKARFLWSVPVWMALTASSFAQSVEDVIYLQDGRERVGRVIEIDERHVLFGVKGEAEPESFGLSDVQRIEFAAKRSGDEVTRVEDLDDPLISRLVANAPGKFFYPDSGFLTLYRLTEKHLHKDGSYTHTERIVQKVLLERGESLGSVARYFKKDEETLEVDFARTINPDGTVTPITEAALDVSSVNPDTPEYEKQQQLKFAMKRVGEDSILDYQITKRRSQTDLLNPFAASMMFQGTEPILESELRIIIPRDRKLAVAKLRADHIEAETEEVGEEIVYTFKRKTIPRIIPEPYMPPWADLAPLILAAEQTTWDDVGDAYRQALLAGSTPSPAMKKKVAELVDGAVDVEDRARRVYRYFAKEIRHIWVGPDEYSYAPRPVAEVFEKHAGNTTDKAALLRAMLCEAGVPADVVLTGTKGGGKLAEGVPCIKQVDDALVSVTLSGRRTLLTLDDETARFGQVSSEYQGMRGLLVTSTDSRVIDIPLNQPTEEQVAYSYQIEVTPSGDLNVAATETPSGNYEMGYRSAYKGMKDEELRRMLEVSLTGMHPIAKLNSYTIENLDDMDEPLKFAESYTLEDYALGNENLLVFRLPQLDYDASAVGKPSRRYPMRWDQLSRSTHDITVTIPYGFRVYYAGKAFHAESVPATFDARFLVEDGKIRYQDEYVKREVEAPQEAYKDYKACLETMARVPKEWIVLERIK